MKDDKTKLKNWVDGDTFAVKIENQTDEYNGRYLILTKKLHPLKPDYDEENKFFPYVYAKITKECRIPQSIDELNSLDFIKCFVEYYDKDTINIINNGKDYDKLIPDEFNYLYVYFFSVDFHKKNKDIQSYIYIGNFDITPPEYEIISERTSYICVTTKFDWIGELIKNYKNYNLHEGWQFQTDGVDNMGQNYFMWYNIIKQSDELVERLEKNFTPKYSFGWGTSLYDSDIALDVKGSYVDVYKKNKFLSSFLFYYRFI